jgi:hypothetical protein
MLLSCLRHVSKRLLIQPGNLLWWRNIFVLTVKVVLSTKLTRSCFVTFLLACTTVVTCLGGSDLFSPDLSLLSRILA